MLPFVLFSADFEANTARRRWRGIWGATTKDVFMWLSDNQAGTSRWSPVFMNMHASQGMRRLGRPGTMFHAGGGNDL